MADEQTVDTGLQSAETPTTDNATETGGTTLLTGEQQAQGDNAGDNGQQEQGTAQQGDAPKADGDKPTDNDWTLDVPEGMNPEFVKELTDGCKKFGMTKDVAEKVLAQRYKEMQDWDRQQVQWREQIAKDAEFGGVHFGETVALAQKALNAFDTDGTIRALLDKTGYGNNPDIIKVFARAGRAMGEDVVIGGKGGTGAQRSLAERLYND